MKIRFIAFSFLVSLSTAAQYTDGQFIWTNVLEESLGSQNLPENNDDVDPSEFYGLPGDFSGGYNTDDAVADFKVYDQEGNYFSLSETLQNSSSTGKYTILFNGSNSCIRFTNFWNSEHPSFEQTRSWVLNHLEDFNWVMVYGLEAHPLDVENCSSNCPPSVFPGPSGIPEYQHASYEDRLASLERWTSIQDGTLIPPNEIAVYSPGTGAQTGTISQNYVPCFPAEMSAWADNPDNGIYNTFFRRPFGILVLDCSGTVVARGDWFSEWLEYGDNSDVQTGIQILEGLLASDPTECSAYVPYCTEESTDTDADGYCDEWELQNDTDSNNPCSPDSTDDDGDTLCNALESILGTDSDSEDTDGDGLSDAEEINQGSDPLVANIDSVEENTQITLDVYPNPAANGLTVKSLGAEVYSVKILDMQGKILIETKNPYQIDVSRLQSGTYVMEVRMNTEHTLKKVLIKA